MSKERQSSYANAYYSVPEFAALAGVSKQAVYDRIKRDLSGYTRKEGGRTVISGEALPFVGVKMESKAENQLDFEKSSEKSTDTSESKENQGELLEFLESVKENQAESKGESKGNQGKSQEKNQDSKDSQSSAAVESSSFLDYLIRENARLLSEIDRKDEIIKEKEEIIKEKDSAITGYADQFAAFAHREQEISARALTTTGQAQLLHAMSGAQDMDSPDADGGISNSTENISEEKESESDNPTWRVRLARWLMKGK